MTQASIPCGRNLELRLTPRLFGEGAPGVELRLWSTAAGYPADTRSFVVVPAEVAAALADALRHAAKEACMGPLFAPALEERQ